MRSLLPNHISDPKVESMHMSDPNLAPQVRLGPVERVIATGIAAAAFTMLSWLVYTSNQNSITIAIIQKDVSYIQGDLKTVKQSSSEQYPKTSATDLERRVGKIESKLGI